MQLYCLFANSFDGFTTSINTDSSVFCYLAAFLTFVSQDAVLSETNNIMPSDSTKLAIGVAVGVGALTVTAVSLGYWYKKHLANLPPKKWRRVGEISELNFYPIKSCAPIKVSRAQCKQLGLEDNNLRDRVFMVITPEGQFVTARAQPRLVLIQPHVEGDTITLTAPGMLDFQLSFAHLHTVEPITTSVWQQPIKAVDCGEEVAKWLSRFICSEDVGLRLVFYPHDKPTRAVRPKNVKFDTMTAIDAGALHDATSYMLFNELSLADLNSRIDQPVTAVQFRPNFVVKGPTAFEEDDWDWIRIGDTVTFRNVKLCTRCIFTNIDPVTASRNKEGQPLKTLKQYRSLLPNESPCLGIHMGVRQTGVVAIGDAVYVADTGN